MKAVQAIGFGGPDVLRMAEVEAPTPISTEVLVRVQAAGINPVDIKTRRGSGVSRWVGPPPFVLGWDVAGTVAALGYGVTRFEVGESVYGMPRFPRRAGCYAEFVTAPSRQLARAPRNVSVVNAGALPLAALTAWQCLVDTARVHAGMTVLVHGATGGVGHLAGQIAAVKGARVVTTNSKDREALQARGLDVAVDLVGGDDVVRVLRTLRRGGLLVEVADDVTVEIRQEADRLGVRVSEPLVEPDGHALEEIAKLVESGDLMVTVDEVFPLEQAARAHERLERGGVRGKLVLEVIQR